MEGWSKGLWVEHGLGAYWLLCPRFPLSFVGTSGGVLLRDYEVDLPQASLSSPRPTSSSPQASLPPLNSYTPIINTDHIFQGKNSRNCRTKAFWATPRCWRQLGKCSSNTEAFILLQHVNTSRERLIMYLNILLTNQSHPK